MVLAQGLKEYIYMDMGLATKAQKNLRERKNVEVSAVGPNLSNLSSEAKIIA